MNWEDFWEYLKNCADNIEIKNSETLIFLRQVYESYHSFDKTASDEK